MAEVEQEFIQVILSAHCQVPYFLSSSSGSKLFSECIISINGDGDTAGDWKSLIFGGVINKIDWNPFQLSRISSAFQLSPYFDWIRSFISNFPFFISWRRLPVLFGQLFSFIDWSFFEEQIVHFNYLFWKLSDRKLIIVITILPKFALNTAFLWLLKQNWIKRKFIIFIHLATINHW